MKRFHLPLLAALPAVLAGCQNNYINNYSRTTYPTYEACMLASQAYIAQGIPNPCQWQQASSGVGFVYFGPWMYYSGGYTRVIGYDSDGHPSRRGVTFDRQGRATGRFAAPKVTRGGFSTGSRSSGQVGTGPVSTGPISTGPGSSNSAGFGRSTGNATVSPQTPNRVIVPGTRGNRTGGSFGG